MIEREATLTPRQQARRMEILEAVRSHLAKYGYEGVKMRKVAEQANVSPSTLYGIYKSKEYLILHAIKENLFQLAEKEHQFEPGLERFVHRLEAIANLFVSNKGSGHAITKLFLHADKDSFVNQIFLVNAIEARENSLREMLISNQLTRDIDVEFYSRALVSVTWGTAVLWSRGFIPDIDFQGELIRSSLMLLLPNSAGDSYQRMLEIIGQYSKHG